MFGIWDLEFSILRQDEGYEEARGETRARVKSEGCRGFGVRARASRTVVTRRRGEEGTEE